jgi:hypothetical protein
MAPRLHCPSLALLVLATAAGDPCPHRGSLPVRAARESGPPSGCAHAPASPAWDLFTPAHRAPAPSRGMAPGDARERARLLVRYRCTGWWLVPRVVAEVRALGSVTDAEERACAAPVTGS